MVLVVLGLLPFALIEGPGAEVLDRLGWTDRDESFTELYFPDHLGLPGSVPAGSQLEFEFSIRNREGSPTTYEWEVLVGPEPATSQERTGGVVAAGERRLDDGEVGVVVVDAPAPLRAGAAVVSVVLVGRTEAVHFPVTIEPG